MDVGARVGLCLEEVVGVRQGCYEDLREPEVSVEKKYLGRGPSLSPNTREKRPVHRRPSWAWWGNRTGEVERPFSQSSCPATLEISQQPAAEGGSVGLEILPSQPGLFPASRPQTRHFLDPQVFFPARWRA